MTYDHWRQWNRIFLLQLALIAVAALLIDSPAGGHPLALRALLKYLDVTGPQEIQDIERTFPFQLVDSIVLLGVFYLMVNLFHRAHAVLRDYAYLGRLENEIRTRLHLSAEAVSFTRERRFYWTYRSRGLETVKYAYAVLLGLLLVGFLYERLRYDRHHAALIFLAFDSLISIFTIIYYAMYVSSSIRLERKQRPANPKKTSDV